MNRILFVGCLLASLVLGSCTHESKIATTTPTPVTAAAGTWKISMFLHNASDEKSMFDNYTFAFPSTGVITATNGSSTTTGTFNHTIDGGEQKVVINFSGSLLGRLNEDWDVVTNTASEIDLQKHNDPGEALHFTKQ